MRLNKSGYFLALCAVLSGVPVPASAANFSFAGVFSTDDQVATFQFVASGSSAVIRTWSYAGGTDANPGSIPAGGFDPYVALFGHVVPFAETVLQAGTPFIGENNDGAGVALDPVTFVGFDSLLDTAAIPITLVAGQKYWVVLTQYDNFANGGTYGAGFHETGNPTFTAANGCSNGQFCDSNFDNRTANWALDITGVTSAQGINATVPEPRTGLMLGVALAGMLAARRRKSAAARQSLK